MMRLLIPAVALVALAACDVQPTKIGPGAETTPTPTPTGPPVELPPSIAASKQYRCADNSLAFVEWFSGGKGGLVRTERGGSSVRVQPSEEAGTFTGGGYVLKGDKDAVAVQFASPDKPKVQRCRTGPATPAKK